MHLNGPLVSQPHLASHCILFPKLPRVDKGTNAWPWIMGIQRTRLWGSHEECKRNPTPDCLFSQCVSVDTATLTIFSEVSRKSDHDWQTQVHPASASSTSCTNHRISGFAASRTLHTSDSIANQASSHLGSIATRRAVSQFKRKNDHKDRRRPRCKLGQWWTILNLIRSANTFTDSKNSTGIPKVVLKYLVETRSIVICVRMTILCTENLFM